MRRDASGEREGLRGTVTRMAAGRDFTYAPLRFSAAYTAILWSVRSGWTRVRPTVWRRIAQNLPQWRGAANAWRRYYARWARFRSICLDLLAVSRLLARPRRSPSQTWRTFLANHVRDLVSLGFFTVPTARLRVLFVLVVLVHHRRSVVHFNVTEHPTATGPPSRSWTPSRTTPRRPTSSAIPTRSTGTCSDNA